MKRWLSLIALAALCALAAGCATTDPDAASDIPWNAPQPWEGSPQIPGLQGRWPAQRVCGFPRHARAL